MGTFFDFIICDTIGKNSRLKILKYLKQTKIYTIITIEKKRCLKLDKALQKIKV